MKGVHFTDDQEHILFHRDLGTIKSYMDKGDDPQKVEMAGRREKIFFDPCLLPVVFIRKSDDIRP